MKNKERIAQLEMQVAQLNLTLADVFERLRKLEQNDVMFGGRGRTPSTPVPCVSPNIYGFPVKSVPGTHPGQIWMNNPKAGYDTIALQ